MHAELAAFFAARAAIGSADHTCTDGCSCGIQLSLRLSLPVDVRAACLLLSLFAFVLVIALTCVTTFPEYSGCTLVLFPLIARCIIVVYGTAVLFDDRLLSGDSSRVLKKCRIHTIVVLIAMRVIFEAETQTSGFDPAPRCTAKSVVSSFR